MFESDSRKYVMHIDGKPIGVVDFPEFELPPFDVPDNDPPEILGSLGFSGTIELSGTFYIQRRMSRKRLIKLLMAHGKSRNTANAIARTWGGNYAANYLRFTLTDRILLDER